MKKFIYSFLISIFFVVALAHLSEAEFSKDAMISYLKSFGVKLSDAELNAKEGSELVDMAIEILKKDKSEEKDPEQAAILQRSIEFYEDLKANFEERTKIYTPPITDPNHVSKVRHVDSEEDFDNQVKNSSSKLVVVDFFATWCGPCKSIAPFLDAYADKYELQVVILKVNVDEQNELASDRFQVSGMPTFIFFKNGENVERFSGADSRKLEDTIVELLK